MIQVGLFVGGLFGFYWWVKGHWFPALVLAIPLGVLPMIGTDPHAISPVLYPVCYGLPWLPMLIHHEISRFQANRAKERVSDNRMVIRL